MHVVYVFPLSIEELVKLDKRIPEAVLPEGYSGKILLVSIGGSVGEGAIILRSGDDWHREILRNTEVEMQKYGISSAHLQELGGAWVRFDEEGNIIIYGISDEFGACDKGVVAMLLGRLYPGRIVQVAD